MGSQRDLSPLGMLPSIEKDPAGFQAEVQRQLDEMAFFVKRGMTQDPTKPGLYLPVSPSLPTNPQRGHIYFDGTSDVGKIYDGAWKRLGTPVPWATNRTGITFTNAAWAFPAEFVYTFTPPQKCVVKMFADWTLSSSNPAFTASAKSIILPAPTGETMNSAGVSTTGSASGRFYHMATLAAGVAYQIGIQVNTTGGTGTLGSWIDITFHHPA